MTAGVLSDGPGGGRHSCDFCDVISVGNLFDAWREFCRGKRSGREVAAFELRLEDNIFRLREELLAGIWKPVPYVVSLIQDPKLRTIHIADVRDRVLYQAVYRKLYDVFDPSFIHDVYSSRDRKGTHAGVKRFEEFAGKVSQNHTRSAFVLKCDIKKFFDSINHAVLLDLISRKISGRRLLGLIHVIVGSFHHSPGKGLPLGNVTSQLFANIYMNELDQFVKHKLKAKYYIRYCDDFVILDADRTVLEKSIDAIRVFLSKELTLDLHPRKVEIRKIRQGTDFLGYVSLPHYLVLRTKTKKRMFKKIRDAKKLRDAGQLSDSQSKQILASYMGMLSHCKSRKIAALLSSRGNKKLPRLRAEAGY